MQLVEAGRRPLRLRLLTTKDYTGRVIQSFANKGLARFYQSGSKAGIQAKHAE